MERRIIKKRQIRLLYIIFSVLFVLVSIIGFSAPRTSNVNATSEDFESQDGGYVFSSETVTRCYLDIPLSGLTSYLEHKDPVKKYLTFARQDYNLAVIIRFDNALYNGKPILVLGNLTMSMPGAISASMKVEFKENMRVNLFPSAYNYLQLHDYSTMTISAYMNGTGVKLDSIKDKGFAFKVSGCAFDNKEYDSSVDDPNSDKFDPDFVTDGAYEKEEINLTGWDLFKKWVTENVAIFLVICGVVVLVIVLISKK